MLLKPHIDLPNAATDSRTNIAPTDRTTWFSAYTAFITHYAEIVQRSGVEEFRWAPICRHRRRPGGVVGRDSGRPARYHGIVLYAAGRECGRGCRSGMRST